MEGALLGAVAWRSRAGGVLTAWTLRGSPRGGAEGGEESSSGSALEDRIIDRCGKMGSQRHGAQRPRGIDRSVHPVKIAEVWLKTAIDSKILL